MPAGVESSMYLSELRINEQNIVNTSVFQPCGKYLRVIFA